MTILLLLVGGSEPIVGCNNQRRRGGRIHGSVLGVLFRFFRFNL